MVVMVVVVQPLHTGRQLRALALGSLGEPINLHETSIWPNGIIFHQPRFP